MSAKKNPLPALFGAVVSSIWNLPGTINRLLFRSLFRKLLDRFHKNTTAEASAIPFITHSSLPDDFPTNSEIDIDDLDGLLALELAQGRKAAQAIALWRSRDHFIKSKDAFQTLLKNSPTDEGLLLQFLVPTQGWLKRLTIPMIYGGIVTLVAVFATIEAMRNDYSWLFGRPQIDFVDPGKQEHDFLVHEPFAIDYPMVNPGRCNARIEKIKGSVISRDSLAQANGLVLQSVPAALHSLEPNKTDVFPIRATGLKPGEYELIYKGELSNDWLRHADWAGLTYKIHVWPECEVMLDVGNASALDQGGHFSVPGTIYVGRLAEHGLKCRAATIGLPGIRIEEVQLQNAILNPPSILRVSSNVGDSTKEVAALVWTTQKIERFTRVSLSLTLASDENLTKERWLEIAKTIKMDAEIQ
jgi:hypothetical protein